MLSRTKTCSPQQTNQPFFEIKRKIIYISAECAHDEENGMEYE